MSEQAYAARPLHTHELNPRPRRPAGASPLGPLALAAACALTLATIWLIAELVPSVHMKDAVTLHEFTTLSRPRLDSIANFLLRLLNPTLFILWAIALVAVALARGEGRVAVAVIAVLGLSPLTAETLKPLLAHAHDSVGYVQIDAASWPSGHSTAASALAMAAVLVAPPAFRLAVATAGALSVLAVSGSLLMLAWHMPSDVLGGWFVAALWTSLAVAALRLAQRLRPTGPARHPGSGPPAHL